MSTILSLITLTCILVLVQHEVRALLSAYALTQKLPKVHLRPELFKLRYYFESAIFHEAFAAMRKKRPTYSVYSSYYLFLLTSTLASSIGDLNVGAAMGAGIVVGGAYFAKVYGKRFLAYRARVERVLAKGHPMAFHA
jgi:hypothetical protein